MYRQWRIDKVARLLTDRRLIKTFQTLYTSRPSTRLRPYRRVCSISFMFYVLYAFVLKLWSCTDCLLWFQAHFYSLLEMYLQKALLYYKSWIWMASTMISFSFNRFYWKKIDLLIVEFIFSLKLFRRADIFMSFFVVVCNEICVQ